MIKQKISREKLENELFHEVYPNALKYILEELVILYQILPQGLFFDLFDEKFQKNQNTEKHITLLYPSPEEDAFKEAKQLFNLQNSNINWLELITSLKKNHYTAYLKHKSQSYVELQRITKNINLSLLVSVKKKDEGLCNSERLHAILDLLVQYCIQRKHHEPNLDICLLIIVADTLQAYNDFDTSNEDKETILNFWEDRGNIFIKNTLKILDQFEYSDFVTIKIVKWSELFTASQNTKYEYSKHYNFLHDIFLEKNSRFHRLVNFKYNGFKNAVTSNFYPPTKTSDRSLLIGQSNVETDLNSSAKSQYWRFLCDHLGYKIDLPPCWKSLNESRIHFVLKEKHDINHFLLPRYYEDALSNRININVNSKSSLINITGDIGVGKTTLVCKVLMNNTIHIKLWLTLIPHYTENLTTVIQHLSQRLAISPMTDNDLSIEIKNKIIQTSKTRKIIFVIDSLNVDKISHQEILTYFKELPIVLIVISNMQYIKSNFSINISPLSYCEAVEAIKLLSINPSKQYQLLAAIEKSDSISVAYLSLYLNLLEKTEKTLSNKLTNTELIQLIKSKIDQEIRSHVMASGIKKRSINQALTRFWNIISSCASGPDDIVHVNVINTFIDNINTNKALEYFNFFINELKKFLLITILEISVDLSFRGNSENNSTLSNLALKITKETQSILRETIWKPLLPSKINIIESPEQAEILYFSNAREEKIVKNIIDPFFILLKRIESNELSNLTGDLQNAIAQFLHLFKLRSNLIVNEKLILPIELYANFATRIAKVASNHRFFSIAKDILLEFRIIDDHKIAKFDPRFKVHMSYTQYVSQTASLSSAFVDECNTDQGLMYLQREELPDEFGKQDSDDSKLAQYWRAKWYEIKANLIAQSAIPDKFKLAKKIRKVGLQIVERAYENGEDVRYLPVTFPANLGVNANFQGKWNKAHDHLFMAKQRIELFINKEKQQNDDAKSLVNSQNLNSEGIYAQILCSLAYVLINRSEGSDLDNALLYLDLSLSIKERFFGFYNCETAKTLKAITYAQIKKSPEVKQLDLLEQTLDKVIEIEDEVYSNPSHIEKSKTRCIAAYISAQRRDWQIASTQMRDATNQLREYYGEQFQVFHKTAFEEIEKNLSDGSNSQSFTAYIPLI